MSITSHFIALFFAQRRRQMERFMRHPVQVQQLQLEGLMAQGASTVFGAEHGFAGIRTAEDFARQVPLSDYDHFAPLIDRTRSGEQGVVWPGEIRWFAKSSGTTSSKSKFIPVSDEGLRDCHLRGPMDVLCLYAETHPDTKLLSGRTLTLGGSHRLQQTGGRALEGDLSAILIDNTPKWASWHRAPRAETALIPDFEEKVQAICRETIGQRITSFAGVPSWNLVMMNKVLEYTGKDNLLEVWPELELFVHGGMSFAPYREQYHRLIPSQGMHYMETYNASEGFFGIQNDPTRDDMLLMLDYGVYYEFLPMSTFDDPTTAVPLEGVRMGVNYALVITTCNGLWRYLIGDTVEFTCTDPYKIKITGRTKHFINAFGEELIIDNAEMALRKACECTGASISDYTAAPIYMDDKSKGSHQWLLEFSTPPRDESLFTDTLDKTLQELNSDYEAKRYKNTTLQRPTVTVLPTGTFYGWMKGRGKAGGQNKVPRLFNTRVYVDQLLELI